MKKKIINWGILSSAKIGWEHVIPAILKSKNSKLVAIASRNTLRAKKLAQKFKIDKSYGSYQELYKDQEIDVIYNPFNTEFAEAGNKPGNIIENGLQMFLFQAQKAFSIWHNIEPKIDQEVIKFLQGKN